jgi:hypothetical protein
MKSRLHSEPRCDARKIRAEQCWSLPKSSVGHSKAAIQWYPSNPPMKSDWWFGTFFIFPYIGNNHPNWLIFFRGVETTNQKYFGKPTVFGCTKWFGTMGRVGPFECRHHGRTYGQLLSWLSASCEQVMMRVREPMGRIWGIFNCLISSQFNCVLNHSPFSVSIIYHE